MIVDGRIDIDPQTFLNPENLIEYRKIQLEAYSEFDKITSPIWEEYLIDKYFDYDEYRKIHIKEYSVYEHTCIKAFIELYTKQEMNKS